MKRTPKDLLIFIVAAIIDTQIWVAAAFAGPQSTAPVQRIDELSALLQRGHVEEAARLSNELISDPLTRFDSLLYVGRLLAEYKAFSPAEAAFARAVQVSPTSFAASFDLGRAYLDEDKLEQARQSLARAVELRPESFQARLLLGAALIRLNRKAEGLSQLERAERLQPKNVQLLKPLAVQYSQAGSYQQAIRCLRLALEKEGADPGTYLLLIEAQVQAGDDITALETSKEAVRRFPRSARLNFVTGVRLQALGRFSESEQYFQRCTALDPSFPEAYAALGELEQRRGEYSRAVALFTKASNIRPDYIQALIGLAEAYRASGSVATAEQVLNQALLLNPQCSRCHLLLSQIYAAQNQIERSETERQLFLHSRQKSQPR